MAVGPAAAAAAVTTSTASSKETPCRSVSAVAAVAVAVAAAAAAAVGLPPPALVLRVSAMSMAWGRPPSSSELVPIGAPTSALFSFPTIRRNVRGLSCLGAAAPPGVAGGLCTLPALACSGLPPLLVLLPALSGVTAGPMPTGTGVSGCVAGGV